MQFTIAGNGKKVCVLRSDYVAQLYNRMSNADEFAFRRI